MRGRGDFYGERGGLVGGDVRGDVEDAADECAFDGAQIVAVNPDFGDVVDAVEV